jgi:hypothetical protein
MLFFSALKRYMTCHSIYWQKARTKSKDIGGSDRLTAICVCQRVKQQLKCNTGKVCNCWIKFLLTMVLSIEKRVFLVEYVFQEGNRYTDLVQEHLLKNSQKHLYLIVMQFVDLFRNFVLVLDTERIGRPSKLNDKKLMDISDSMLQSPSKSLRKLTLMDITSNTFYNGTVTFRMHICRKCLRIKLNRFRPV